MMEPKTEKIALFIDGANLYATAKSLGFDVDYKRLLREFHSRGYLLRPFYYTAVMEDQEYSSITQKETLALVRLARLFIAGVRGRWARHYPLCGSGPSPAVISSWNFSTSPSGVGTLGKGSRGAEGPAFLRPFA
jgi:NYN domain-containing protein